MRLLLVVPAGLLACTTALAAGGHRIELTSGQLDAAGSLLSLSLRRSVYRSVQGKECRPASHLRSD